MQTSYKVEKPTLYVVATPIGNLSDMTLRAIETLKMVDIIICEDTRNSGKLLKHFHIDKPLMSYHAFSDASKEDMIINLMNEGKHLAMMSDAGTPGISDPGYGIIHKVISKGYHVVAIPGASAVLTALVSSGLVMQPFTFIGFLPRKQGERQTLLNTYIDRPETLVIYESPLRVEKTVNDLLDILGNRQVALCRELTKTFETIIRTDLVEASTLTHNTKGEYVIVLNGALPKTYEDISLAEHVRLLIKKGMPEKDAMKEVAKRHHVSKSVVYQAYKIDG